MCLRQDHAEFELGSDQRPFNMYWGPGFTNTNPLARSASTWMQSMQQKVSDFMEYLSL